MILIILGAPGAGKGTQAKMIKEKYGLEHLSTGDLLRNAVSEGTELGKSARGFMDAGDLVPDDVIIGIIRDYLKNLTSDGVLLDGFPRTIAQAEGLDEILMGQGDVSALTLEVDDKQVVERLSARRSCQACGKVYNPAMGIMPRGDNCDCGGELYQRDDDRAETISNRLNVYHTQTEPIVGFYKDKSVLKTVDGMGNPDEVFSRVMEALG